MSKFSSQSVKMLLIRNRVSQKYGEKASFHNFFSKFVNFRSIFVFAAIFYPVKLHTWNLKFMKLIFGGNYDYKNVEFSNE